MNIAFATCVQLGKSCIESILTIGGRLNLLITLADDQAQAKSGRIYLDDLSSDYSIPLLKIKNINDSQVIETLKNQQIDWLFIVGWSQIARSELLNTPHFGCIGMHPSLLPIGRGRAAVPWAILKELKETGVTLFKLDEGVDTGDIIGQGRIQLSSKTTATELYKQVNELHEQLIKEFWPRITSQTIELTTQNNENATIWEGRKPEDGEIFSTMTMHEAEKMVRAVTHPYPGAFYKLSHDKIIRIWSATIDPNRGEIRLADGYLNPIEFTIE